MRKPIKLVLVYQAGIANVFEVQSFALSAAKRGACKRIMQHAFEPCEWFCRGAERKDVTEIRIAACNRAGDILGSDWDSPDQDGTYANQPFADKWKPGAWPVIKR